MKVDILAIGAHPDDVELGCAGTLLRHIHAGYSVGILDLTLGELGTRGDAPTRTSEAMRAATKMGAAFRWQLDLADGFFMEDEQTLCQVITAIRASRPEIILANAKSDRHPDHGRGSSLTSRAAFLSGLRRIETSDAQGVVQEAWRPRAVYHFIQDRWLEPDLVVDITPFFADKLDLVRTFSSQFFDPSSAEPETPISSKDFFDFLDARARDMGRPAGYTYAEGFQVERYPGVSDLLRLD